MNIQDFYNIYLQASNVTIDSRKINAGDLFFAFSGDNFNAATLAQKAIDQGAIAVIVEQKEYEDSSRNIFYVPSTLEFLQELAQYHRSQIQIPIIGLTGSNGKTTTKELISTVLAKKFNVQFTKGNLNNHIGVPLTLLSITAEHEVAVVEMGANHQKEIELLCTIAKPDYGYITNFGKAHLEGFGGFEGVIKGKSELYDFLLQNKKTVLINNADPIQVEKTKAYDKKISFGTLESDYFFESVGDENYVGLTYNGQTSISRLTGAYNFTNLCAAASLGLHFGVDFKEIQEAIASYVPTNMRSQIMQKEEKTLILDTYNANPSSMIASLQNFTQFKGTKTVIMGDMLELGTESVQEHRDILQKVHEMNFEQVITVGPHFKEINTGLAFENADQTIEYLKANPIRNQNVLLKGSRGIALEKIIDFV